MSNIKWNKPRSIKNIFDNLKSLSKESNEFINYVYPEARWAFNPEQVALWDQIVISLINHHGFSKTLKPSTINNHLYKIYAKFLADEVSIEDEILSLINQLREELSHQHTFIFKTNLLRTDKVYTFENISIGDSDLKNEEGVTIKDLTQEFTNTLNNPIAQQIGLEELIDKAISDTVMVVREFGDEEFSKERALSAARNFLNELNFFSNLASPHKTQPCLEIDKPNSSNFLKINHHKSIMNFGFVENSRIFVLDFTLQENTDPLNSLTDNLTNILKIYNFPVFQTRKDNHVAMRASMAINWYSDALLSRDNHIKFLFCCIGLESIFSINPSLPITETLSHNCSVLLAAKLEDRGYIKRQVKKLYRHRSGVAHGRKPEIMTDDLKSIFHILKRSIILLLDLIESDSLCDDKSLLKYFENKESETPTPASPH